MGLKPGGAFHMSCNIFNNIFQKGFKNVKFKMPGKMLKILCGFSGKNGGRVQKSDNAKKDGEKGSNRAEGGREGKAERQRI